VCEFHILLERVHLTMRSNLGANAAVQKYFSDDIHDLVNVRVAVVIYTALSIGEGHIAEC